MPNIRILAKAVLQIFCSQGCSYTKCLWKRRITPPKIFGIGVKVNQFIYTFVCNYMPNIRILAKAVLQIFCSQGSSYTKCLCLKKGSNSTKNLQNRFKSNQFIYILICTYMPNIRFLAKEVLQIFVHKVVSIQNAYVRKRGITQLKIYDIGSNFNQFIYILICSYSQNIRILAKAVLQIFCSQGCSYTKCLCQ